MDKNFIKTGAADVATLVQIMEASFASAPYKMTGGRAMENVRRMHNPVAYAGYLHFEHGSTENTPAFMIEDGRIERVVLFCENGIWYAR